MPARLDGKPRRTRPVIERFWRGVDKNGPLILETHCWIWTRARTADGYGSLWIKNRADYPHRFSFELHKGKLPDGLRALHRCDNPPCVNPDHLFAGTDKDNMQDMLKKGRYRKGRDRNMKPELRPVIAEEFRRGMTIQAIVNKHGITPRVVRRWALGKLYPKTYKPKPMSERIARATKTTCDVNAKDDKNDG